MYFKGGGGQKSPADTSDTAGTHQKLILKKEEVAPAVDTSAMTQGLPKFNHRLAPLLRVRATSRRTDALLCVVAGRFALVALPFALAGFGQSRVIRLAAPRVSAQADYLCWSMQC